MIIRLIKQRQFVDKHKMNSHTYDTTTAMDLNHNTSLNGDHTQITDASQTDEQTSEIPEARKKKEHKEKKEKTKLKEEKQHEDTLTTSPSSSSPSSTVSTSPRPSIHLEKTNDSFGRTDYKLVCDNMDNEESIVQLNVGGTHYSTTLQTLRKDPNCMLYTMFSGIFKSKRDQNGCYFIDRDGKFFRYVLNYLRDGVVDLMGEEHQLRQLLREAQFYQIVGLIKDIEDTLDLMQEKNDQSKKGQYAVVYLGGYGKQSQIYTKDTGGGFSESCVTLNKLASEGYHIEGVASGEKGHYYAILRTNEVNKNIFNDEVKKKHYS